MPSTPAIESVTPKPWSSSQRSSSNHGRTPPALRTIAAVALVLGLAGCGLRMPTPYSPPLQQGNVIEQDALSKLKPGMTRSQVRFLLGTPLVVDVFRNDRWDYVYFLRRQGDAPQQRRVTVIFEGDQLARLEGDVVAGSGTVQATPVAKAEAARSGAAKADTAKAVGAAKGAAGTPAPAKPDEPPQRGFFGRMLDRIGF